MADGRDGLGPQRGSRVFARPTQDFLEEVRDAARICVDAAAKKVADTLAKEEAAKGKEKEIARGLDLVRGQLERSLNRSFDLFEEHAARNVFFVPDEIVFLDAAKADAAQSASSASASTVAGLAEIDRVLSDIVSRQQLNAQIRQRIEQAQAELGKLESIERAINLGVMSFDAPGYARLAQQSAQLHAQMHTTEQELLKQGIPVATKADEKKKEERQAAIQASHQGLDDLLDLVSTNH